MGFTEWGQGDKVRALERSVRAGLPMFSRNHAKWCVRLPVGTTEVGAHVEVKRADGSIAHVRITRIIGDYPKSAPTFTLAEFKTLPPPLPHFTRYGDRWLVRVPLGVTVGELVEIPTRDRAPALVRVTSVVSTRPDNEVPDALVEFERAELDKPS